MKKNVRIALMVLMAATSINAQTNNRPTVKTRSGWVEGILQEGTQAFLGIPYARVERFMPPLSIEKWKGVRKCNHWGPQAMQNTFGRKLSEDEMSENRFLIHHGNLSASYRESAEMDMKDDDSTMSVCATATLELGIDIGRLERAFHVDAPFTVSGFLQRLGRTRSEEPESMMIRPNL